LNLAELDELRGQKEEELKQRFLEQQEKEQQSAEAEKRVEIVLRKILDPDAKARLKNVKLVNQELYWNAVQQLFFLVKKGAVQGRISDEQVKEMLKLMSQKREVKIKRR